MTSSYQLRSEQRFIQSDYPPVFKDGKRFFSNGFLAIAYCDNTQSISRLGLAISKKHLAKATSRNTVKRIARETFRYEQHKFNGLNIIFVLTKKPEEFSKALVWKHIRHIWKKIDTFYNAP